MKSSLLALILTLCPLGAAGETTALTTTGVRQSYLRLNDVCSWDSAADVSRGDIIRVAYQARLEKAVKDAKLQIVLPAFLEAVAPHERVTKITHRPMQWGSLTWKCPNWVQFEGAKANIMSFRIAQAPAGAIIDIEFSAVGVAKGNLK